MLAKTGAGLEQELVHRIIPEEWRLQGVEEILAAEHLQDFLHEGQVVGVLLAQRARERPGLRVGAVRQFQCAADREAVLRLAIRGIQVGQHVVAHALHHRIAGEELEIAAHESQRRHFPGHVEREQPAPVVRLRA